MNLIERLRDVIRRGRARRQVPRDDSWHLSEPPWLVPGDPIELPDRSQYAPKSYRNDEQEWPMSRDHDVTAERAAAEYDFEQRLRSRPSLETPIEPFQAPELSERIPQAYRALAEEVVMAVSTMILKTEEARQKAVEFLKHCDMQAKWHDDFIHNYIAHETATAEAYSTQWQKAIDELTGKRATVQALAGPAEPLSPAEALRVISKPEEKKP